MYYPRPLAPLRDAVSAALGAPSREDVRRGVDPSPLWRDSVLRSRLVQAVADHARRSGAGRVEAADPAIVPLASAVAERLMLPLERPEAGEARQGRIGAASYLMARVLDAKEEERFSSDKGQGKGRARGRYVGAGVLFWIRPARDDDTEFPNILYIIDL